MAAPAPSQPFPRLDFTFAPAWWHARFGMDFSDRRVWMDPIAYVERDREQRRLLHETFGDVDLGEADPKPRPRAGDEYGHRWMSAFWGCEVVYLVDQAPHATPFPDAWERLAALRIPDVATSPVAQHTLANARVLTERYGRCECAINYGGPLNNAVSVLGESIYLACAAEPKLADRVLRQMAQAVITAHDEVACPVTGADVATARKGSWGIGNCPVGTIDPQMYTRIVLPVDQWFARQFSGPFNLHHCGIFDRYREAYRPLHFDTMDLGPGSDLRAARAAYPRTPISAWVDVGVLPRLGRTGIDAMIRGIVNDLGPMELIPAIMVGEAGPEVSDETVRDFLTAPERLKLPG
ncbi:MAG TPA: uroporphyrinogen decarboxylase family protein [Spirochaetia bacterium]|nr:uroporphyrinogen decarboxylase family protein [Spirochaetia bacterium]